MPGSKSSGFLAQVSMMYCGVDGLHHRRHQVVFGPVVLVAGSVREDLADCDFVAAREIGHVFADGIVERELALLLEKEDGRGSELLGDGADGVAHVGRGGLIGMMCASP